MNTYLFQSLDGVYDAVEDCQLTANLFPDLASSHRAMGVFKDLQLAYDLLGTLDRMFRGNEQVTTELSSVMDIHTVRIKYTLSLEEREEAEEALKDYLVDLGGMDPENEADRELLEAAEEVLRELSEEEDEDDELPGFEYTDETEED